MPLPVDRARVGGPSAGIFGVLILPLVGEVKIGHGVSGLTGRESAQVVECSGDVGWFHPGAIVG